MRLNTALATICSIFFAIGIILVVRGDLLLMVVLSGSMEPIMMPGDMVVVVPVTPDKVVVGDVISFHAISENEQVIVTHRVVAMDSTKGLVNTKGDNNNVMDLKPVKYDDIMGKAVSIIPLLGYLVTMQRQLLVFLVFIPSALVIFSEVRTMMANPVRLLRQEREQRKTERLPVTIKLWRLTAIFILASLPFWALAYPAIGGVMGGTDGEGAKYGQGNTITIKGEGLVDQIYVIRTEGAPALPGYGIISPGKSVEVQVMDPGTTRVSMAPAIIPIFWVINLASVHPAFPALVIGLLPGLLISATLSPFWVVRRRARSKRKRRRLPFGTSIV
jgi:signal peptidase